MVCLVELGPMLPDRDFLVFFDEFAIADTIRMRFVVPKDLGNLLSSQSASIEDSLILEYGSVIADLPVPEVLVFKSRCVKVFDRNSEMFDLGYEMIGEDLFEVLQTLLFYVFICHVLDSPVDLLSSWESSLENPLELLSA